MDCVIIVYYFNNRGMGKKDKQQQPSKPQKNQPKHKIAKPQLAPKQKGQAAKNGKTPVPGAMTGRTNLFQIIPEHDDFAALGNEDSEEDVELHEEEGPEEYGGEESSESYKVHEEQEGIAHKPHMKEEQVEKNSRKVKKEVQKVEDEDEDEELAGQEGEEDIQEQMEGEGDNLEGEGQQQPLDDDADCDAPPLEQDNEPVDASVISLQIQQTINILMNTSRLGEGKPRKYYIERLRELLHQYYGYNFELIDHFLAFLNPTELVQLFEANETQRPLTIRTNTLKTRRKQLAQNLIQRGVNLDPLAEWSKVGIKVYESKVPIGATPEYLAGHYMLQSASSLLPVIALDPQPGERILDMASAPGGKTTYIAQLMKNTGCIFANDLKKERLKALQFNLYRLGVTNTTVTCRDGRKYPKIFPGSFDRVLLDAPCTGLGIISKDPSIKANRLLLDIYRNSHVQKELLTAAIDCARVGGTIVYSTCSISPLQNEEVVNYALRRRFVKLVDIEVEVGEEGLTKFMEKRYQVELRKTRRIYPHVHNMDGFYVAKLVKVAKGKKQIDPKQDEEEPKP